MTPEAAVVSDLHWLIHQGHVIEFANGILETAKKPLPRPPRPEKKKADAAAPAEGATPEAATAEGAMAEGEVTTTDAVVEGQGAEAETAGDAAGESAPVQDESGASAGADVSSSDEQKAQEQNPQ
jgi:hypothetical protein